MRHESLIESPGRRNRAIVSGDYDWCTPPDVVEMIRESMGSIDTDPCSNPASVVGAALTYYGAGPDDDGLVMPWRGNTYINPPYGMGYHEGKRRSLPSVWIDEVIRRWGEGRLTASVMMLLPANTSSPWFHDALCDCHFAALTRGRIKFLDFDTGQPRKTGQSGQVLFLWSQSGHAFRNEVRRRDWSMIKGGHR